MAEVCAYGRASGAGAELSLTTTAGTQEGPAEPKDQEVTKLCSETDAERKIVFRSLILFEEQGLLCLKY